MSKHKKKINHFKQDKITEAQQRNDFLRKLNHLCTVIAGPKAYSLIPAHDLDRLFKVRAHPIKIIKGEGQYVHPEVMKNLKSMTTWMLKRLNITYTSRGYQIPLDEYFTVGLSLVHYMLYLKVKVFPGVEGLVKLMPPVEEFEKTFSESVHTLYGVRYVLGISHSDFSFEIYKLLFEQKTNLEVGNSDNCFIVYSYKPELKHIIVDGISRTAFRVGWPPESDTQNYMEWITINLADLNINHPYAKLALDVYIQPHAIQRIEERLDIVQRGDKHYEIYNSLLKPKVVKTGKNHLLIEYRFEEKKLGYLKAEITDGVIIILTFLFITMDSTPEGELLHQLLGLSKEDKKYLAIDKISTFVDSDITKNEKIKQIFIQAGCGDLFDLEVVFQNHTKVTQSTSTSERVMEYLGWDKE